MANMGVCVYISNSIKYNVLYDLTNTDIEATVFYLRAFLEGYLVSYCAICITLRVEMIRL